MSQTERVLQSFGAEEALLSQDDRLSLDEDGYLMLPGALDEEGVAVLRSLFDRLVREEGERAGIEVHQEEGTDRLANLVDKDPAFDRCWNHPKQLAAVAHVLGWHELKLFSLNGRSARPGEGRQALHTDWGEAVVAGDYQVCNSIWMLDDFTAENGATRVVPGSHRWGKRPGDAMEDPEDPHPREALLRGRAGTCVVFNAHVWHGGTRNRTQAPRRALHGAFVRREHQQQTVQRDFLRAETLARLTPAQRYLLEV